MSTDTTLHTHSEDLTDDGRGAGADVVRTYWIATPEKDELTTLLAELLNTHMRPDDELHVTYSAMQTGWKEHQPQRRVVRPPTKGWTELEFEYSALVVLRPRA